MKNFIKNNIKFILGTIIGLVLSGVGVYALTVTAGQVAYDNTTSGLTSTNVKDAIDELNTKADNAGVKCAFEIGDYISLTPVQTTYTIKSSLTGWTSNQTINIAGTSASNGLRLWRVIDIHSDGSFDVVSEYVSSDKVYFNGTTGYANFVGALNTIAAQYQVPGYTIGSRIMGYGGQTEIIGDTSVFDGTTNTAPSTTNTPDPTTGTGQEYSGGVLGDTLYLKDIQLVGNVYKSDSTTYGDSGLKAYKVGTTTSTGYWLGSRRYGKNSTSFIFLGRYVGPTSGNLASINFRRYTNSWNDYNYNYAVRPILTVKSGVTKSGGSGSKTDPYTLS